jgi:hypothetical protein
VNKWLGTGWKGKVWEGHHLLSKVGPHILVHAGMHWQTPGEVENND